MKRCMYCGNENEDSAVACAVCGNPLPDRPDGQEDRTAVFGGEGTPETAAQTDEPESGRIPDVESSVSAPEKKNADLSIPSALPESGEMTEEKSRFGRQPAVLSADSEWAQQGPLDVFQDDVLKPAGTRKPAKASPEADGTCQVPAGKKEDSAPESSDAVREASAGMPETPEAPAAEEVCPKEQADAAAPEDGQTQPSSGEVLQEAPQAAQAPEVPPVSLKVPGDSLDGGDVPPSAGYGLRPEGTVAGVRPGTKRRDTHGLQGRADHAAAQSDFGVGRGQTYGARQQAEAQPPRSQRQGRDQYGSAGYGYRGAEYETPRKGAARSSTGQSKNILITSRKMVKGFLFFLMALLFTAMVATNICNIALPGTVDSSVSNANYNLENADSSLQNILGNTANGFGTQILTELADQVVSMAVNVNGIITQLGRSVQLGLLLVFLVPNALYALGLWIMFFQTKRGRVRCGKGGYTLARVMMVLKFIVACLVVAVGLVISVYFVVVGASSAQFTSSFIQGLIMLIVMILAAILTVMYYIQWIFVLKCAKANVHYGQDVGRAPAYVGIISIILAVIAGLLLVPLARDDYLGLAARGSAALYFLISGIWTLVYRAIVKRA